MRLLALFVMENLASVSGKAENASFSSLPDQRSQFLERVLERVRVCFYYYIIGLFLSVCMCACVFYRLLKIWDVFIKGDLKYFAIYEVYAQLYSLWTTGLISRFFPEIRCILVQSKRKHNNLK